MSSSDTAASNDYSYVAEVHKLNRQRRVEAFLATYNRVTGEDLDPSVVGSVLSNVDSEIAMMIYPPTDGGFSPLSPSDVHWVVSRDGDLGVRIGDQFFYMYRGRSLQYENGIEWRPVAKRDYGDSVLCRDAAKAVGGKKANGSPDFDLTCDGRYRTYSGRPNSFTQDVVKVIERNAKLSIALDHEYAVTTGFQRFQYSNVSFDVASVVSTDPAAVDALVDLQTHRKGLDAVFQDLIDKANDEGDTDNASYFQHEREAYARIASALSGPIGVNVKLLVGEESPTPMSEDLERQGEDVGSEDADPSASEEW